MSVYRGDSKEHQKMVEIKKARKYMRCFLCYSEGSTFAISLQQDYSTKDSTFLLCPKCAKKLAEKILSVPEVREVKE